MRGAGGLPTDKEMNDESASEDGGSDDESDPEAVRQRVWRKAGTRVCLVQLRAHYEHCVASKSEFFHRYFPASDGRVPRMIEILQVWVVFPTVGNVPILEEGFGDADASLGIP